MFRVKLTKKNHIHGINIVILWILGLSLVHTVERGDHLHMGICIGPVEFNFGTSIWRKLLP